MEHMPLVRVEHLHYRYPPFDPNDPEPDERWILEDVSIEVDAGEFLGILGTTGSGKSTLCLALNGLVPQQMSGTIRGDVWVDDINTKRRPVVEIATKVGIVFQDPEANFLGLNVEDEVAFGLENLGTERDVIEERIDWALDLVRASNLRLRSVGRLSGGQKQRVAIASVLAMLPSILVLDDPTAELDPVGTAEVLEVINSIRRRQPDTAVVMTSSDPGPIVAGADHILVLDDGKVVFSDNPERFLDHAERLQKLGIPIPPLSELAIRLNADLKTTFQLLTPASGAVEIQQYLRS